LLRFTLSPSGLRGAVAGNVDLKNQPLY
jgi:hypothetical protein